MAITCKTCGANVSETSAFCGSCGTPVKRNTEGKPDTAINVSSSNANINPPTPESNVKKFIAIFVGLSIVAIVITSAYLLNPSRLGKIISNVNVMPMPDKLNIDTTPVKSPDAADNYENVRGATGMTPLSKNLNMVYTFDGESEITMEVEGYSLGGTSTPDGTKQLLLMEGESGNITLYLASDKLRFIDDGLAKGATLSSSGDVAYVKEYESSDDNAELWLYADGEKTLITENLAINAPGGYNYVISPDGKALAYVANDNGTYRGFVWKGESHELGKDIYPLAVSNNAEYIYYVEGDSFYVQTGIEGVSKENLGEHISRFYGNKDLTEIIYYSEAEAYISINGGIGESFSIYEDIGRFVFPKNCVPRIYLRGGYVNGVSSFANTFYMNTNRSIIHIGSDYETNVIEENLVDTINNEDVYLADDGKTLTYLKNGTVYQLDGFDSEFKPTELVYNGVKSFIPKNDGSAIYFVTENDDIFYQKGTEEPVLISDDYSDDNYYALFKGDTLYYTIGNKLYVSTGSKGELVKGLNIDDHIVSLHGGMFYVRGLIDRDIYYRSYDGEDFTVQTY